MLEHIAKVTYDACLICLGMFLHVLVRQVVVLSKSDGKHLKFGGKDCKTDDRPAGGRL